MYLSPHAHYEVATVSFYDSDGKPTGTTLTGAVSSDGNSIQMPFPWTRFAGKLSGLWRGPGNARDYYVVSHDIKTSEVRTE